MPHTTRRRKGAAPRPKRVEIPQEDGWTTVTKKMGGLRLAGKKSEEADVADDEESDHDFLSVEQLQNHFEKARERFKATECATGLQSLLERELPKGKISEAVCLGLGTLCVGGLGMWRSLWQLIAFKVIIEHLSPVEPSGEEGTIGVYAQDPRFRKVDEEFLQSLGITPLTGTEGFDKIGERTFAYAPFLENSTLLDHFERKNPQLFIGNDLSDAVQHLKYASQNDKNQVTLNEPRLKTGEAFLEGRKVISFPEFDIDDQALRGLRIYIKDTDAAARE